MSMVAAFIALIKHRADQLKQQQSVVTELGHSANTIEALVRIMAGWRVGDKKPTE
jgi:hypothetical protein